MYDNDAITLGVCSIIAEVLELEAADLRPDTYVFRDLDTESIDLLEYGIGMSRMFGIRVQDSMAFLKDFRLHLAQADREHAVADGPYTTDAGETSVDASEDASVNAAAACLRTVYPHIAKARLAGMIQDIRAGGNTRPVLQVRDIAAYVRYAKGLV